MPIIRASHNFDTHFTTIPNAWVRDPRISLKAKGLLVQLLSHTPGWTVSIGSLAQANDCGRDSIRSAVIELEEAGYLIRSQDRNTGGQFAEVLWVTNDPSDNPLSDKPLSGNPTTVNPTPKKNNPKEEHKKEELPQPKAEDMFERFWNLYPRKVEKIDAHKAYRKAVSKVSPDTVIEGVVRLASDPNLPPKQFVPYPASWLRAGGWTNEPYPPRQKSKEELELEERNRIKERDARDRERREAEKAAFVPAPRCVHDRIWIRCDECKDTPEPTSSG
jgi:hypothetical protein